MSYFDTDKQRAAGVILILGAFLAIALWPFVSGLIGALVLYVIFAPVYRELSSRAPEGVAAGIVIVLAILLVVMPVASMVRDLIAQEAGRGNTEQDFASLILSVARGSGLTLTSEDVDVSDGLGGSR